MRGHFLFLNLAFASVMALCAQGQPASLLIEGGRLGPVKLGITGTLGDSFLVEQSPDLGPTNWNLLLSMTLPQNSGSWIDSESVLLPQRFYRRSPLPRGIPPVTADNFRLIDHEGKSRELSYDSSERAIVLVFAEARHWESQPMPATLKALRDQFRPQGVLFWIIDPGPAGQPTLASQALALVSGFPILRDRAQLVASSFGIRTAPEVVCISTADWQIFYRGAIDDRVALDARPATQPYLAIALASFLSGQTVSIHRTKPTGSPISPMEKSATSYSRDIAPLLEKSCVRCHSPGNIAPWSMTNHAIVQAFSPSIKAQILAGRMPPWHADPAYGVFSNDASLKPEQAAGLLQWIAEGSPRGDGPDPLAELFAQQPPPTNYPFAWPAELGKPDYIVTIPKQSIPATGEVAYWYPQVATTIPSNVWLRAAVVLPGNVKAVHHSLVFAGNFLEVILNGGGLGGFFAGYVPGARPGFFPAGTGKLLAKNATFVFQMHYTTTGRPETDQTQLGLYFMPQPPARELKTHAAHTVSFSIPPSEREYVCEAQSTPSVANDILLYEMAPHMHYRGSHFKYEALYPNGTSEVLLSVPKYDFHWQSLYRLAQPKRLPAGTIIRCRGAFDNSAHNLHNPDPSATVLFGEQTDDEMFIGYFNYSVIP